MAFFNDSPVSTATDDQLFLDAAVTRVAEALRATKPPFVLGVHGDWGAGKTSALWLLRHRLPADQPVSYIVWFEPWRYQGEASPAVALLQAIRTQFSLENQLIDKAGKIARVSALTALALLDKLIAGVPSGLARTAREEGERLEKAEGREILAADTLRTLFEQAVRQMLGEAGENGTGRLVVLVDDLDRCSDESTVRLLEAMKLYFSTRNAMFVIAADPRAVERAVARVLFKDVGQDEARKQANAREYCGKLIQAVWEVPVARDLPAFVRKLWPDTAPVAGVKGSDVAALEQTHRFLPPNPRQIKRFLGELRMRLLEQERLCALRPTQPKPFTPPSLTATVAFQAIQTFHPNLYRVLLHHPQFIEPLQTLCREPTATQTNAPEALKNVKVAIEGLYSLPTDPDVLRCAGLLRDLTLTDSDLDILRMVP